MKIGLTAHIKQHAGDVLLECQDSFDYNLENLSFAVSDGVSQAYRPELWSRILTKAFVDSPQAFFVRNETGQFVINSQLGLSDKWSADEQAAYNNASPQEQFILDMKKNSINISAATFIGVKLNKEGIEYHTIGDSVLFFFDYRSMELKAYSSMMPESGELVFNNSPEYIDSNECNHGNVISGIIPYKNGILLMATDALSDWIIERKSSSANIEIILQDMISISTHEDYDKFVDSARNGETSTKLKDDDTTFIALEFTDVDNAGVEFEQKYAEKFDKLYTINLINELNNAKNEYEAQRSARSKSDLERKNIERQLDRSNKDLESAKNEIESLQNNVQGLNAKINKLQGDLNTALSTKSSLQNSVNTLTRENQNLRQENQSLKRENNSLTTDNQQLTSENQQLKKASNATTDGDIVVNLRNQLNTAHARYRQVMDELELFRTAVLELKGRSFLSPFDFESLFPFIEGSDTSTGMQVTTIKIGTPTKDGGFKI